MQQIERKNDNIGQTRAKSRKKTNRQTLGRMGMWNETQAEQKSLAGK